LIFEIIMDRLTQLLSFYNDDSNDAFTIYALALEYLKSDETKALHYFNLLLKNHADYLPMYYQLGKFYETKNIIDTAVDYYSKGLALAQLQNNKHAINELRSALDDLT